MKPFLRTLALLALVGCTDLKEGQPSGGDAGTSQSATGAHGAAPQAGAHSASPGGSGAQAATPERDGIIGKTTARIVDFQRAKQENPGLVEVENRAQGSDPLSFAASAYISASSGISVMNFQHNLDVMKQANEGRDPTFEEFEKLRQQMGIRLSELPPYQMYAYDQQRGRIVILEDPADKAERYQRAGLSPEGT